jgi:hypothetical protein
MVFSSATLYYTENAGIVSGNLRTADSAANCVGKYRKRKDFRGRQETRTAGGSTLSGAEGPPPGAVRQFCAKEGQYSTPPNSIRRSVTLAQGKAGRRRSLCLKLFRLD